MNKGPTFVSLGGDNDRKEKFSVPMHRLALYCQLLIVPVEALDHVPGIGREGQLEGFQ